MTTRTNTFPLIIALLLVATGCEQNPVESDDVATFEERLESFDKRLKANGGVMAVRPSEYDLIGYEPPTAKEIKAKIAALKAGTYEKKTAPAEKSSTVTYNNPSCVLPCLSSRPSVASGEIWASRAVLALPDASTSLRSVRHDK